MLTNRSIPVATVLPEIAYPDVGEAAKWLEDAFGFRVRLRIADHRIQMHVGVGAVVLVERKEGSNMRSSTMVRVEQLDEHYRRAVEHGAKILHQPEDHIYGERQYAAEDFAGNRWKFSQSLADVDPATWGGVLESVD